jgi:pimeloyl-ACP methyl ester carboxylesterase
MRRLFALAALLMLAACQSPSGQMNAKITSGQTGTLETADGYSIAYSYLAAPGSRGVILLHMLGGSKEDYAAFAQQLHTAGFAVIAIDFRGHGDSSGNINTFTDEDYRKFTLDVKAAKQFLKDQGIRTVGIVGASIGANTALNYAVNDPDVRTLVLISPGEEYHGVTTSESAKRYSERILFVAARDDDYSAISAQRLAKLAHKQSLQLYPSGGHGTRLFAKTDLDRIARDWLVQYVR